FDGSWPGESVEVRLLNVEGVVLLKTQLEKGQHQLKLPSLNSGLYILFIRNENFTQVIRFIKN
ncbi:T9SS type A sorting domain-containing protein, partial [Xanthovirga aplysinae]|uniref:T9SS type A sorting domain-containing protein n=1 Tax=Xanthovirga aplysinae TaxID=2529853 RepID=UPI0012BCC49D